MNVVVTGGGTAGHVFPALATATTLRDHHAASIVFVGGQDGQEAILVPEAGFRFVSVHVSAAQARVSVATLRAVGLAFRGSRSVRSLVRGSDVVVSIGGFASAPAALAARRTRRPLVLIEPNSVPGIVNRIAARWASAVATTFENTATRLPAGVRVERTGNPIRTEIAAVPERRARLRIEACEAFGLEPDRTTVFVFGGSQGALHLDQVVAEALPSLAHRGDLQLLVSAGPGREAEVARAVDPSGALRVAVVPFVDRMDRAFALADVVVARSGGSVAEVTACGLPSILVPYPHATENHQEANARELVAAGAARMVLDRDLSSSALVTAILDLVDDDAARTEMAAAARGWARPDAAARIADLCVEVAGDAR
jgi:UDP-N-acetylglucosamine--N-acetylmuramyl-(pentapeptide) pyrophosphoryl-undecaprenol N-acetylglucosamine transferase